MKTKKKAAPAPRSAVETVAAGLDLAPLTRGRVVVVGLGGIGLILARYLTLFLSSLRGHEFRLLLCDGDSFEPANAYRMDVPDYDNKAAAVARELGERFSRPGLSVRWLPEYVTPKNARKVVAEGDCVFAALDNHASRRLLSRRCARLQDVVLISGGNDGVEDGQRGTYANVQVYIRAGGRDLNPPLEQFHPEIARPADRSPAELDCLQLAGGGGAPQLLFTNLAAAAAMCSALLRLLTPGDERMYDEVCLDVFEAVSRPHWLRGQAKRIG